MNSSVKSLEQLRAACSDGRVAELKGFGAKSQQKILEGLEFLDKAGKRFLLYEAVEVAQFPVSLKARKP